MLFDLQGKRAIVTGGNRGLGFGISEGLCEQGCSVAIIASSNSLFSATEELQKRGFDVYAVQADLADTQALKEGFDRAVELLGGSLDILVNNAGIQRRSVAEDFSEQDWLDVIQVNLNAVFLLCQRAGRLMLAHGGGKIINIASMLSYFGGITVPAYAASKGGVAQLTKALSNEWASKGICVNAIAPGYMDTEMNSKLLADPKRYEEIIARIPKGRWGTGEDMKGAVIFLASAASDYVNGAIIPVDGGYLAK